MIQRMNENGDFLWGTTGYLISDYDSYGFDGSLIANDDSSYYVVWRDQRNMDGIYCQRIDQNGNIIWNNDVELVNNTNFYYRTSIRTSDNNLIVSWLEDNEPYQIIVQKVDDVDLNEDGLDDLILMVEKDVSRWFIIALQNESSEYDFLQKFPF